MYLNSCFSLATTSSNLDKGRLYKGFRVCRHQHLKSSLTEVKLDRTKENVITMTLGGEFHATDSKSIIVKVQIEKLVRESLRMLLFLSNSKLISLKQLFYPKLVADLFQIVIGLTYPVIVKFIIYFVIHERVPIFGIPLILPNIATFLL